MTEEIGLEKCNFWNFRSHMTLTLTLDWVIGHTAVHHSSTCIYVPNFTEIGKKLFFWKDYPQGPLQVKVTQKVRKTSKIQPDQI